VVWWVVVVVGVGRAAEGTQARKTMKAVPGFWAQAGQKGRRERRRRHRPGGVAPLQSVRPRADGELAWPEGDEAPPPLCPEPAPPTPRRGRHPTLCPSPRVVIPLIPFYS
jgi:hypothetical protein